MRANRSRRAEGWTKGTAAGLMLALLVSLGFAGPARAQDKPSPEQLQKMYDDALAALNHDHERINQLAEENEKLKRTVDELKKQLDNANNQITDLRREQAEQADKAFYLRSHYAAWEAFIRQYPELLGRWKLYMESDFVSPHRDRPPVLEGGWPTSAES